MARAGEIAMQVKEITVEHFRGIKSSQTMSLADEKLRPSSIVLLGDNGTGKSSFIDAVEFALQGACRDDHDYRGLQNLRNIFVPDEPPRATVILEDGSAIEREIREVDGKPISHREPHPSFAIAPFVLRRSDVLRFWITPSTRRQLLLVPFVSNLRARATRDPMDQSLQFRLDEIDGDRETLIRSRTSLIRQFFGIDVSESEFPRELSDFERLVKRRYYSHVDGETRDQLRRSGIRFNLPQGATKRIDEIRDTYRAHSDLRKRRKDIAKEISRRNKGRLHAWIAEYARSVEKSVSEGFTELSSNAGFVRSVRVVAGELSEVSFEVLAELKDGSLMEPQRVLSEANLDLLALLIYMEMIREASRRGQSKVLILDDVLQSIDQTVRISFGEFLAREFAGWQMIFSVHDRLWRNQLVELLRRNNVRFREVEIRRWSIEDGPELVSVDSDPSSTLRRQVDSGTPQEICVSAGTLLEQICDGLSISLGASVIRRKDDRYTLGDLWPGIRKRLSKTALQEIVTEIDHRIHLRNMIGAHYNQWAEAVSRAEAVGFGRSVVNLFSRVRCGNCVRWIEAVSVGGHGTGEYSCRCRRLSLR